VSRASYLLLGVAVIIFITILYSDGVFDSGPDQRVVKCEKLGGQLVNNVCIDKSVIIDIN
jgi:hypothetical protein